MNLPEKDQKQIINIIDTLIEASEHFLNLTKEKKFTESIHIFSSIIEGYTAVQNMINNDSSLKNNLSTYESKITKHIKTISSSLENHDFLKVTEILQFAFIPNLKKWKKRLLEFFPEQKENEVITVGIYENKMNPIDAYSENRLKAIVREAERTNTKLIFFTSEDVNLYDQEINADYLENNQRKKGIFPFPDVIHNIFPKIIYSQSRVERKLRKQIPFTSFVFGDKFHLPKKLVENRKFAELLAPFKVVDKEYIVHEFLRENEKAVIKPVRGARGENIYFVQKKGDRYRVTERKHTEIMNKEKFSELLQTKVVPKYYIVQKYINARTKSDEPFDFRAHMQKNGEGKWQITKIYPRTGSSNSIQIELIKGGKLRETEEFLVNEYGEQEGKKFDRKLKQLAMDLAFHIDKIHGLAIDEMGLDIAIDVNKRFWLHEANIGPQTFAHEEERAKNVIAYSKYLAKNKIFFTNQYNDKNLLKNEFNSKKSNLEFLPANNKPIIAILGKKDQQDDFAQIASNIAHEEDAHFYYFSPRDIDYEEMLIRGLFWNGHEWIEKITNYPDVIYDRLKSITKKNNVYEEFQKTPIISELNEEHLNYLDIFESLANSNKLDNNLSPMHKVEKAKDLIRFIDEHNKVICKVSFNPNKEQVLILEKLRGYEYLVKNHDSEKTYNKLTLEHHLKELIKKDEYFAMKYNDSVENNSIRVQLMKDVDSCWKSVQIIPVIRNIFSNEVEDYSNLHSYLNKFFNDTSKVEDEIQNVSIETSNILESKYKNLSEIELFFELDLNSNIKLSEVLLNQLDVSCNTKQIVKNVIKKALHLTKENNSVNKI